MMRPEHIHRLAFYRAVERCREIVRADRTVSRRGPAPVRRRGWGQRGLGPLERQNVHRPVAHKAELRLLRELSVLVAPSQLLDLP